MRPAISRLTPLLILIAANEARAQLIRGEVTDGVSGEPVEAASVLIFDRYQALKVTARTGRDGSFTVRAVPGRYLLQVAATGYRTVGSREVDARATDTLNFTIRLPPEPVDLAAVKVTARPRGVPDPSGFFRRQEIATGRFVGPEEIEELHPTRVPDLLRAVPGFHFYPSVAGELLWVSGRGRGCTPTVYLDGGLARRGTSTKRGQPGYEKGAGVVLDEIINPAQVAAVEIYQDATESPVRFRPVGDLGGGDCAIVVLWSAAGLGTKDGNPVRD
jgi:hypothetical protein